MDSATKCRKKGWTVGTRLIGNDGWGPSVIEITAIGERQILARQISHNGDLNPNRDESSWDLCDRTWKVVPGDYDGKD